MRLADAFADLVWFALRCGRIALAVIAGLFVIGLAFSYM